MIAAAWNWWVHLSWSQAGMVACGFWMVVSLILCYREDRKFRRDR